MCFWYPKTPLQPMAERQTCFLRPLVAKRKRQKVKGLIQSECMETSNKLLAKTDKPKHKGGRPKVKIKRETHVKVRLTTTERFFMAAKAKDAGMRLSDWIRAAARTAKVVARLKPEDLQIMRMLTGMANNLNQLTKLAHRDGLLTIATKCGQLLIEIDEALKYFNSNDRQDT